MVDFDPVDFAQTAITELDGTSGTATYGPPYNSTPGASQSIGPFSPEQWLGVHHPIDTANDYVLAPLNAPRTAATWMPPSPLLRFFVGPAGELERRLREGRGQRHLRPRKAERSDRLLRTGRHNARLVDLDGSQRRPRWRPAELPQFYGTDYTKPLLFIADGTYLANLAQNQHLSGDQWGMMNETGNYPGQAWLWLYTLWYQVPPMNASASGDLQVWAIMMGLTVLLALVPFIPGFRSIPRWTRVYRLIWRQHYRGLAGT